MKKKIGNVQQFSDRKKISKYQVIQEPDSIMNVHTLDLEF